MKKISILLLIILFLSGCNVIKDKELKNNIKSESNNIEDENTNHKVLPEKFAEVMPPEMNHYEQKIGYYTFGFDNNYLYNKSIISDNSLNYNIIAVDKDEESHFLSNIEVGNVGLDTIMCNDTIIIPELIYRNEDVENFFILKLSYLSDDLKLQPFFEKELCSIPLFSIIDDKILMETVCIENGLRTDNLGYFTLNDFKYHKVVDTTYIISEISGLVIGTMIACGGGMDGSIYYQQVVYQNEIMDLDGSGYASVFCYDINSGKTQKVMDLEKKIVFISGGKGFFVTTDFIGDSSDGCSGKIYIKDQLGYKSYEVPEVKELNDIIECRKIGTNKFVLLTLNSIYLYDINKFEFSKIDFTIPLSQGIYVHDNIVAYTDQNKKDGTQIFHWCTVR